MAADMRALSRPAAKQHRSPHQSARGLRGSAWRGIESLRDAERENERREERLRPRAPSLAQIITRCAHERWREQTVCAICARAQRLWQEKELARITSEYVGPHETATLCLATYEEGHLEDADIGQNHEQVRQRLNRAGFRGAVLIGGTEVAWKNGRWLLHLHLLAIGVEKADWRALRARWPSVDEAIPIKVDQLRDAERQLSYLQKFATYHRPGARGLSGPGWPYPLPPAQLEELITWWSQYSFADFLFAYGARRRGTRIVVDA